LCHSHYEIPRVEILQGHSLSKDFWKDYSDAFRIFGENPKQTRMGNLAKIFSDEEIKGNNLIYPPLDFKVCGPNGIPNGIPQSFF